MAAAFRVAGYAVVGVARSMPGSDDPDVLAVSGDIADAETAQRVVELALERFGRIDTLINNAGIFIGKPFTDYSADDCAAMIAVNLTGFFHLTQRAIRPMVDQGGGHIVNVTTSLVDHARSASPAALTSLTKGGLDAVTRSLAIEYAGRGVRVNAVSLGVIKTDMHGDPATWASLAATHPWAGSARSAMWSAASSISNGRPSSRARRCTSTAARPPDTERLPQCRHLTAARPFRCDRHRAGCTARLQPDRGHARPHPRWPRAGSTRGSTLR